MYFAEFTTDKYVLENLFPKDFKGTMIEAGAGLPEYISMSKAFREKGWRTICVEPNPRYVQMHKDVGNEIYQYALSTTNQENADFIICEDNPKGNGAFDGLSTSAISLKQGFHKFKKQTTIKVDIVTLDWLLKKLNVDKLDFAAIDVEGWELEVMKGFDPKLFNTKIIVLECYDHYKKNIIKDYNEYMSSIGYILDKALGHNYVYKLN
jgi:FkbM family methyltransferase